MPEQPDDLLVPADADRTADLNRGTAPASTGSNALVEVEVLDGDVVAVLPPGAVTLSGEAARDVRNPLGGALVESAKTGRRAVRTTYKHCTDRL